MPLSLRELVRPKHSLDPEEIYERARLEHERQLNETFYPAMDARLGFQEE
jgi:hypothetical protein